MNNWNDFVRECTVCRRCGLYAGRRNVVIGRGNPKPVPLLFVGEGPGEQEDIQGEAFVGRAGKLLDLLMEALRINEDCYYIANVVKCRPPQNRIPSREEMEACLPWLRYQVKALKPSIIVCLGSTAARAIIDDGVKITQIRGTWVELKSGLLVMPTYHPAAILRDTRKREDFYLDMKKVHDRLIEIGGNT